MFNYVQWKVKSDICLLDKTSVKLYEKKRLENFVEWSVNLEMERAAAKSEVWQP